ncbi:MAG: hypothetical protein JW751_13005 [Polyangiaceae bacterium]|nr:hypothetical protein [Polyangiaceae bacterium]
MKHILVRLCSTFVLVLSVACTTEEEDGDTVETGARDGSGEGTGSNSATGSNSGSGGATVGGGSSGGTGAFITPSGGNTVLIESTGGILSIGDATLTEVETCTGLALEPDSIEVEEEIVTTIETQVPAPFALYIMLDNSMSMNETGVNTGSSKWQEAVSALTSFVNDPASEGMDVAIQYFHPVGAGQAPDECTGEAHATPAVEMGRLPDQAEAIVSSLESTRRASSTPTVGALTGATKYCATFVADHPDEQCVVVFVTDGQPNACGLSAICEVEPEGTGGTAGRTTFGQSCVDPDSASVLTPIAAAGLASGAVTFTIGMAGVTEEGFTLLNAIAVAGGSDCTPDVPGDEACDVTSSGSAGFLAALNAIRDSITVVETFTETIVTTEIITLPCEWAIPEPPPGETLDPTLVNVNVQLEDATTPMVYVPTIDECPVAPGPAWYYDNAADPTRILVCPATCDILTALTTARVEVLLGCERNDLPR